MRDIVAEATNLTVLLRQIMTGCHFLGIYYRVTQKLSDLGWVDLVLECYTILLGQ